MKKQHFTYFVFLIIIASISLNAQNLSGVTGKKDSTFANSSALKSIQKQFPEAKIAKAISTNFVQSEKDLTYCQIGDYELKLDVFSPQKKGIKNLSAIVFIHGGGWRTGDKSQHHELAKELASKGYVVITPAYRLSTIALFPAAVVDIKTVIKWVKANADNYGINKSKIALAGFSAGGQIAAFVGNTANQEKYENDSCVLNEPTNVQAIIDIDGILAFLHFESGEGDDRKSISAATHYFGYTKEENPELWLEAGALKHTSKESPPTLFINSSVERMHAGREDYIKTLANYNIYTEVHTFENAPHIFPLIDLWFNETVNLIDVFLKKNEIK